MSDDEKTLRARLRRIIDGPPPDQEQPPAPLVQVHVIPEPTAPAAEDDEDQDEEDDQEEQPEAARPWWHVVPRPFGSPATQTPEPTPQEQLAATPGIHVTVNQPAPVAPPWLAPDPAAERAAERLRRLRLWFAYHLSAGAAGWAFGLVGAMRSVLDDAGQQGAAVGIAMGFVGWIVASYLPGLPYMPPALRPALVWAARIPVSSVALALALYAPGTV
ncbi:hypothetical protein ACWCQM_06965 [Streptomyces sp. NPDC002125]